MKHLSFLFFFLVPRLAFAEGISLVEYLNLVKENHPFFTQESLAPESEAERQRGLLGAEDWRVEATPSYVYREIPPTSIGAPERFSQVGVDASIGRAYWSTGGRASLEYSQSYTDQKTEPISIPSGDGSLTSFDTATPKFYEQGVFLSYVQPLTKNYLGTLDRLEYDLAGFDVERQDVVSLENKETFLAQVGITFLDWVELQEQLEIVKSRVGIAEEQLQQTRRKFQANVVDKVDVLRAQDDVWTAKQLYGQTHSTWLGLQAQLRTLAGSEGEKVSTPRYQLFKTVTLESQEAAAKKLREQNRILESYRIIERQLQTQRVGFEDQAEHEVNLKLRAGLRAADEGYGDSYGMDEPEAAVMLEYSYPLGNRTARSNISRTDIEIRRVNETRRSEEKNLTAELNSILKQLAKLTEVLELNKKHIASAKERTKEEVNLYNQGRGDLNFVLAGRDGEQNARLLYAQNAAAYHKLVLSYRALLDELPDKSETILNNL